MFIFQFADALKKTMAEKNISQKFNLVIFVESAIGLLNLQNICARGVQLSLSGPFHLDGVVFGSDDFCADIGIMQITQYDFCSKDIKKMSHI